MVDIVDHLLDTMVEAHCVRDKGTSGNQWLIVSDWLRVRVAVKVSYVRIVHSNPQQPYEVSNKRQTALNPECQQQPKAGIGIVV